MKGRIKAYSAAVNAGCINGTDGNQYSFTKAEWQGTSLPANDEAVTFADNTATARATSVKSGQ